MKKFKFSLEKLLSYRNQILDTEMQKLAVITAQIHECENEITRLRNERLNTAAALEKKMAESISPEECMTYQRYIDKVRDLTDAEIRRLMELRTQREKQIDVIAEAKRDCRSLEILKEHKYEEYLKEDQKAAERELEEFLSAKNVLDAENG